MKYFDDHTKDKPDGVNAFQGYFTIIEYYNDGAIVSTSKGKNIYIPSANYNRALHGDQVVVKIIDDLLDKL